MTDSSQSAKGMPECYCCLDDHTLTVPLTIQNDLLLPLVTGTTGGTVAIRRGGEGREGEGREGERRNRLYLLRKALAVCTCGMQMTKNGNLRIDVISDLQSVVHHGLHGEME